MVLRMITRDKFYGGAQFLSLSDNTVLNPKRLRVWCIDMTVSGKGVAVQSSAIHEDGFPVAVIINIGANSIGLFSVGFVMDLGSNELATVTRDLSRGNDAVQFRVRSLVTS